MQGIAQIHVDIVRGRDQNLEVSSLLSYCGHLNLFHEVVILPHLDYAWTRAEFMQSKEQNPVRLCLGFTGIKLCF